MGVVAHAYQILERLRQDCKLKASPELRSETLSRERERKKEEDKRGERKRKNERKEGRKGRMKKGWKGEREEGRKEELAILPQHQLVKTR
jgi:hypothetical protein